jgi:hypothetical protein
LYAYAQNNPIKYTDPLGLEVTVKTTEGKGGEKTTAITLSGVLIDESSKDFSDAKLKAIQSRIVKELKKDFTGKEGKHKWNITVDIRIAKSEDDIKPEDHVIRIVDDMPDHSEGVLGAVNKIGGKEVRIKAKLIPKKPSDPGNASLERTSSHEVGHALGLRHDTDDDNPIREKVQGRNLMRQTKHTDGTKVNVHQIREMQKLFDDKKLNQ